MDNFKGKNVLILGFGTEGESAANFLLERGAKVTITDVRHEKNFDKEQLERYRNKKVKFILESYPDDFSEYDLAVRSPGISMLSSVIQKIGKQGVTITSATKIFFDLCPCPIIGVTGTKGKGTTSTLIHEMLLKQGFNSYLGGNIGLSPLDFLRKLKTDSKVVLELSSFQLQDLTKSPQISVFLMVTSEHLDYHRDVEEYIDAKRNILKHQTPADFSIINKDYIASNESDIYTEGKVYKVSRELSVEQGCFIKDDFIVLKMGDKEEKILPIKDVLLPGKHNLENVCAAILAATIAGAQMEAIISVIKEFKGLEHRLELVRLFNGVKYYDDSFSTTPETAIAAIEAFEDPEILILGGSSKNSDFKELGKTIREAKNIKAIIGIGQEWYRIKAEIGHLPTAHIVEDATTMEQVVKAARILGEVGDIVILSPACASFDMFKNYKERGNKFKSEVNNLS